MTILSDITRTASGFTLDFTVVLKTDIDDAWSALTRADRLARWMAPYDGGLHLGGTWRAYEEDGREFVFGTVSECEAPHRFTTSWKARDDDETLIVSVTLESVPEGTQLRLVHEGISTEPYGPGWETYLERLEADAAGGTTPIEWSERFDQLTPVWTERFARA